MAQQWIDITTINNSTPFMKVRWKAAWNTGDCWFSETPGLVTDGMDWSEGTSEYGWYSAHRLNGSQYSCSFSFDRTMERYWDESGWFYRDHVKDVERNRQGFYDTTVEISGETYYEIDFNLWSGASGYQLYAPYSSMPWAPGELFVYAGVSDITGNKDEVEFDWAGGNDNTLEITAGGAWSASASENWVTISPNSGASGTSAITITAQANSGTSGRSATISFTCNADVFEVTVNQGGQIPITGDTNNVRFKYTGGTDSVSITSSDNWALSLSDNWVTASTASGVSGTTVVTFSAGTNSTGSKRTATATFTNGSHNFVVTITQNAEFGGLYIGGVDCEGLYLGNVQVEGLYLGQLQIF